jgi:hypothetical protein
MEPHRSVIEVRLDDGTSVNMVALVYGGASDDSAGDYSGAEDASADPDYGGAEDVSTLGRLNFSEVAKTIKRSSPK